MNSQKPAKKKYKTDIKQLDAHRFKAQRGKIIISFMVGDDHKITLVDRDNSTKTFVFQMSDPWQTYNVAKTIKDIAAYVIKLKAQSEADAKANQ